MKLRIIKRSGGEYCPQFRCFWLWFYFDELNNNYEVKRNSLKQAEDWINNYVKIKKPIYTVVREYKMIEAVK